MKLFIIRYVKSNIVSTLSYIFVMVICRYYLSLEFAVIICRGFLPWEFAAAICRSYLPWLFVVGFLCVCKQTFFLCEQILFLCQQIFFNWAKLILFMRISLLTVFLFVIAVAVMGHLDDMIIWPMISLCNILVIQIWSNISDVFLRKYYRRYSSNLKLNVFVIPWKLI